MKSFQEYVDAHNQFVADEKVKQGDGPIRLVSSLAHFLYEDMANERAADKMKIAEMVSKCRKFDEISEDARDLHNTCKQLGANLKVSEGKLENALDEIDALVVREKRLHNITDELCGIITNLRTENVQLKACL